MSQSGKYAIRGGVQGRERLRILARVMYPGTMQFLDRLGMEVGMSCLDVGCGGGDVTCELARRVAPDGRVVGIDMDAAILEIARKEAPDSGVANIVFRAEDIRNLVEEPRYDVVYARFLLTHLADPANMLRQLASLVRPGGVLAVEDIDCSAQFTYPESRAFQRYLELYCAVVRSRGGDPDIGPRLPSLLSECGLKDVAVSVVQPMGLSGEAKLLNPITMENIADAVIKERLASRDEIDRIVRELYEFAENPRTLAGVPRIFQLWGRPAQGETLPSP